MLRGNEYERSAKPVEPPSLGAHAVPAPAELALGPIMHVTTRYIVITLPLLAKYDWHVTGYYTENSFEMRIACTNSNIQPVYLVDTCLDIFQMFHLVWQLVTL